MLKFILVLLAACGAYFLARIFGFGELGRVFAGGGVLIIGLMASGKK